MVKETEFYDALGVSPEATELEIKKAYRKQAIKLHPDKNPGDETAHQKFQAVGEAYQVLSNPQLRAAYDRDGKEQAIPSSGFEDPSEFFGMIFGGEAFTDWIGEISLMKDLTKSMEMSEKFDNEQEDVEKKAAAEVDVKKGGQGHLGGAAAAGDSHTTTPPPGTSPSSTAAGLTATGAATSTSVPSDVKIPSAAADTGIPAGASTTAADTGIPAGVSSTAAEAPPSYDTAHAKEAPPEKTERPAHSTTDAPPAYNPYSQERPTGVPTRPAIMDASESEKQARDNAAGVSQAEKDLRAKEKKKGLTKEQREELARYEQERARIRKERVDTLANKLINRISVWTETDKDKQQTEAFREKTKLEIENLKMESFGIEILHAIGYVYSSRGANHLKSQHTFGIGGFFGRMKEKGTMVKDVWGTISSAMDAQVSMEEMAKAEEQGGEAWTDERRADLERRVTGKILAAAWRGSKFEIQGVLREVCDQVIEDKTVSKHKRTERAQALVIMGALMKDAQRTNEEENENMVFEQLMADAAKKKEQETDKKKHHHHHQQQQDGEAGNGNGKKHFAFRGGKDKTSTAS